MARVRLSTTVDRDLLAHAREVSAGSTDASLVEAALEALLREHHNSRIDEQYAQAYQQVPVQSPDAWGDLAAFLDEAAKK